MLHNLDMGTVVALLVTLKTTEKENRVQICIELLKDIRRRVKRVVAIDDT
jgi:hypothetical protein